MQTPTILETFCPSIIFSLCSYCAAWNDLNDIYVALWLSAECIIECFLDEGGFVYVCVWAREEGREQQRQREYWTEKFPLILYNYDRENICSFLKLCNKCESLAQGPTWGWHIFRNRNCGACANRDYLYTPMTFGDVTGQTQIIVAHRLVFITQLVWNFFLSKLGGGDSQIASTVEFFFQL